MNERHELRTRALRWLSWAEEDLDLARATLGTEGLVPRGACAWAQQAAEKALKALLVDRDVDPPKSHDLARLARMIPHLDPGASERQLDDLSRWSVEGRYPADLAEATARDASAAVDAATNVVAAARSVLETILDGT